MSEPARFALELHPIAFDGSFLSLAIAFPASVTKSISKYPIVSLVLHGRAENPVEATLRFNLKLGPNAYEQWRQIDLQRPEIRAVFDAADCGIEPDNVQAVWLDLILSNPGTNRITIQDMAITLRRRAEF